MYPDLTDMQLKANFIKIKKNIFFFLKIKVIATNKFTNLGSLCVPPAPGNKPSITSGTPKPVFGLSTATL